VSDRDTLAALRQAAACHIDETHALDPLEPWSFDEADLPETYPSAL
jgi:hypothetical protein